MTKSMNEPSHFMTDIPRRLGYASAAAFAALALAGCAVSGERTGQAQIDSSFTTGGFRWDEGGIVYVFAKVRESQGKVEACVAFMPNEHARSSGYLNREIMAAGKVSVAGKRIVHGLRFANELAYRENFAGLRANCVRSSTDWQPAFALGPVEVTFARMTFAT